MKVALCLHGYFDSKMDVTSKGSDGYNHIKKNILDKADVDVIMHSWDIDICGDLQQLYAPYTCMFQDQIDFSDTVRELGLSHMPPDSPAGRSPATILSHFYSISRCFSMVDYSKYDCVIKARFDLGRINRNTSGPGRHNPYPVQCINFDPSLPMDNLYMADWQYLDSDGPADMWFYGSPDIMQNFTTLYDYTKNNMNETNVNAIHLLKQFMQDKNMWNKKAPLQTEWE